MIHWLGNMLCVQSGLQSCQRLGVVSWREFLQELLNATSLRLNNWMHNLVTVFEVTTQQVLIFAE